MNTPSSPQRPQGPPLLTKTSRQEALRLIRQTIHSLGWRYSVFVICILCLASATLLPPELFRFFTKNVHQIDHANIMQLLQHIGIFGGVIAVVLLLTTFGSILCREWLRLNLEAHLRRRVLSCLHRVPIETLDRAERGEWLTKMTGDLANVEDFMTEQVPSQLRDTAVLIGASILFIYHCGSVAILPISAALLLGLLNYGVQRRLAPVLGELRQLNGSIFQSLIENFEGKLTIRTQRGEGDSQKLFSAKLNHILDSGFRVVRVLGGLMSANQFASQFMVTIVLSTVTWSFATGSMNFAEALLVPFYIGLFFGAAQGLAGGAYHWNRFFAEGGRLAHMLVTLNKPYNELDIDPVSVKNTVALDLEKLAVGFGERVVAGPLTMRFKVHETHVLVGASGCGKSTTVEVLSGLRAPLSGQILILGADDQILGQLSSGPRIGDSHYMSRSLSAFVEQRPYIFAGTFRDNLKFGDTCDRMDEELWQVLHSVKLAELVTRRGGLDACIWDRGANLSEGQKYRIALARALLLKRPFLILDEPFASIDEITVEVVADTLHKEKDQRGIIIVSHHLPASLRYDAVHNFDLMQRTLGGALGIANFSKRLDKVGAEASFQNHISLQEREAHYAQGNRIGRPRIG